MDVVDDGEVIRILVELPGVEADDVKVSIRGRVVMIRGTKKGRIRTKEGMRFFCMERYFGGFLKSVAIPRPVNSHHAKTRLKNGLLEVILPRVPDLREKEIEIAGAARARGVAGETMGEFEDKEVATDRDADLPIPDILPVLPLKDVVVFPYIILPLSVSREKSINAVDAALAEQRIIMLVAQRDGQNDTPRPDELYTVGTVAAIMRMLKLPDGRIRLLVQGLSRARLDSVLAEEPYLKAKITRLEESPSPEELPPEHEALLRSVKQNLEKSVSLGKNISPEVMVIAGNLDDPARLADLAASNLDLKLEDAQKILESTDAIERLRLVNDSLAKEITVLTMQQEISTQARGEMDKSQREYYLRQQLRAIQQELGEGEEISEELDAYRKIIADKKIPQEAATEIEKQIKRLERSHPDSAETAIIRTYLDWMTGLPWSNASEDSKDIERARKILDEDHYDIEKVKERILEFLAVHALKQSLKGPILCFVGPPGVGKTSLGRSIARALDRKFVRLSLGGVRDEAEIRGHRRTYVGAMPGRIIQGIHQAGTSNPVFMMDEIDKIGADYRGDPSAALLEVLDPEQNFSFRDHYLAVPYDLSKVLFIATANVLDPIQPAFLDRMEVIRLSGYTVEEKKAIARRHLIPKQMEENGVTEANIEFTDSGIEKVIEGYTREAGLRNLEREIGALCRKVAVSVAQGQAAAVPDRRGVAREDARARQALPRRAAQERRGRRRHRARLDLGRRRHPVHRGARRARQGRPAPDRTARRRHEGVGAGGHVLRAGARLGAQDPARLLRDARRARPRARGRRSRRTARRPASRWRPR